MIRVSLAFIRAFPTCIVLSLALLSMTPNTVQAQTSSPVASRIDALSQQIVRQEIELDRLVTSTHLKNDITTIEKRRRQFLWAVINSTATEAGLIDATALFFTHTRHVNKLVRESTPEGTRTIEKGFPNHVSPSAIAGTLYPQIIGQEINFGGDLFELTYNVIARSKLKKQQLDPKRALKRAKELTHELDATMEERQKLTAEASQHKEVYQAEGVVLKDIEMALLAEFARQYVNARREYAWQNALDTTDLTRNAVGAVGNQISVHAAYIHDNRLNGAGNILALLSAIGITTRPYIAWAIAHTDSHIAHRTIARELPSSTDGGTPAEKLKMDENHLQDLLRAQAEEPSPRFSALNVEGTLLASPVEELDSRERKAKSKRVFDDMARSAIYGPTKAANSIIGVVVGYSRTADVTQHNRLSAAGNLTYTCGQGFNFCELWRERILDERHHHELYAEGKTGPQMLTARLKTLDDLSARLVQPH